MSDDNPLIQREHKAGLIAELEQRTQHFVDQWDALTERQQKKLLSHIGDQEQIHIAAIPEPENRAIVAYVYALGLLALLRRERN
jgi:hypothetical protein